MDAADVLLVLLVVGYTAGAVLIVGMARMAARRTTAPGDDFEYQILSADPSGRSSQTDLAFFFHWPLSEISALDFGELVKWRDLAVERWNRTQAEPEG